ncbi:DUF952 domain-containing protein [Fodinibius halophilus]|uniref:DUF952 domain-containing protein n=1 Tax=Fodinibius halophilus TaxID=1736908 RepID=A0A6M1TE62_9BACT|nr:DUF952 domain-containing protein [Fodinibius halophilus]NGP89054.1 DUF952 domain-containing protein [Fodinibius halophilus]
MRHDLLFHITSKKEWKEYQNNGRYEPETLEDEGFIHCSSGEQIEDTANRLFSDKDKILLLVIDVSTLGENIKYEKDEETGEKFPHLYEPLESSAVIDKIEVGAEDDGTFNIGFSSNS